MTCFGLGVLYITTLSKDTDGLVKVRVLTGDLYIMDYLEYTCEIREENFSEYTQKKATRYYQSIQLKYKSHISILLQTYELVNF